MVEAIGPLRDVLFISDDLMLHKAAPYLISACLKKRFDKW